MSRAAFAQVSGLGEASLNRWENGLAIQNHANDRYLRLLAHPEIMSRLRSIQRNGKQKFPLLTRRVQIPDRGSER